METTATVGSFVAKDYRTASIFQKYGIDFCCKGGKTIDEVCTTKNIDSTKLLQELSQVSVQAQGDGVDFRSWPLDLLADYIEKKHHRYIEESTPTIRQFLDKLCKVHGGNHPELFDINQEFTLSSGVLAQHMKKEELILFPFVRNMVESKKNGTPLSQPGFGTIENPIHMMEAEHDMEGERFRTIAQLTNNYTPPADGCTTYRVAFAMLKEFENDLHMHIHLENNILFPQAIELEKTFPMA
ncbi:MAG: iron-sulfur cluster repair di-iron protein [Crocinitomicaceae bacterium]|nr:iron-sulfur cluster repair di-iron protein [Crocinitomicaceae bacterium]MBK8924635.1 iron-sulfur cluster repair di-iron protein [Crocinitomicaceae bacterium]